MFSSFCAASILDFPSSILNRLQGLSPCSKTSARVAPWKKKELLNSSFDMANLTCFVWALTPLSRTHRTPCLDEFIPQLQSNCAQPLVWKSKKCGPGRLISSQQISSSLPPQRVPGLSPSDSVPPKMEGVRFGLKKHETSHSYFMKK